MSFLLLTSCATQINQNDRYRCVINKNDDFKYLNYFNKRLSTLKIPQNLHFFLPKPSLQYTIPTIYEESTKLQKNNVINICPPIISKNIFDESCLIDADNIN